VPGPCCFRHVFQSGDIDINDRIVFFILYYNWNLQTCPVQTIPNSKYRLNCHLDPKCQTQTHIMESSWRFSDIVRCPAGHRTVPGQSPLKSFDLTFISKASGVRQMCANAGRAPSEHHTVPGHCPFNRNDLTKPRAGAVKLK